MKNNYVFAKYLGEFYGICVRCKMLDVAIYWSNLRYGIFEMLSKLHYILAKAILDKNEDGLLQICKMHLKRANKYQSKRSKINYELGILLERYTILNRRLKQINDDFSVLVHK